MITIPFWKSQGGVPFSTQSSSFVFGISPSDFDLPDNAKDPTRRRRFELMEGALRSSCRLFLPSRYFRCHLRRRKRATDAFVYFPIAIVLQARPEFIKGTGDAPIIGHKPKYHLLKARLEKFSAKGQGSRDVLGVSLRYGVVPPHGVFQFDLVSSDFLLDRFLGDWKDGRGARKKVLFKMNFWRMRLTFLR